MWTEATLEANGLLWKGEFARAIAVLDARVAEDDHLGIIVRIESLLFDEHVADARALFLAHREALHAASEGKADVAVIAAFLLLDDGDVEGARRAANTALGGDPRDPILRAARFCLAAIAHREGRTDDVRRHLAATLTGGGDLFVVRWAELQWAAVFPGTRPPARADALPDALPDSRALRSLWLGLASLVAIAMVGAFAFSWLTPNVTMEGDPLLGSRPGPLVETDSTARHDALVFVEADKVHRAEARLEQARPDLTDLYFVGAAGWSEQDVFAREVRSARALFDARFDTEGRSLVLANDVTTDPDVPLLATPTLRHVLGAVGARMQTEEDILFLFVTSHGSNEGLALRPPRHGPFGPETLTPASLRSMLDDAKVKWRVLVISGCESGAFIRPLQNEHTLVATAASDDRSSYGCAMGNAFTDFGRAVFDEQLRKERSFPIALVNAARVIEGRELEDERVASRPQISEGSAIREKLRELEVRLAAAEPPQPSTR